MPNKNYISGYRRELQIMKFLQERDWFCLRSAGSHGVIDIIAMKRKNTKGIQAGFQVSKDQVVLIQSKVGELSINQAQKIEVEMFDEVGFGIPLCVYGKAWKAQLLGLGI